MLNIVSDSIFRRLGQNSRSRRICAGCEHHGKTLENCNIQKILLMKRRFFLPLLMAGSLFITNGCSTPDEDIEETARKAALEFCDCFKTKSKDACLKELESSYRQSDYMDDRFIEAFNRAQSCDVELEIITVPR
jgi:hypothetical protein